MELPPILLPSTSAFRCCLMVIASLRLQRFVPQPSGEVRDTGTTPTCHSYQTRAATCPPHTCLIRGTALPLVDEVS